METSPCRQDSLQKFLRDREDHLFLTTVNKFGSSSCDDVQSTLIRRTRLDEVRRTRTEYHTSSTLHWKTD